MKKIFQYSTLIVLAGCVGFTSCKKEYSCEGYADNNKPPIEVAGLNRLFTLSTDSVLPDRRSSSDTDGMISSYLWTKM